MNNYPFISVIIPCREEGEYVAECLDYLIKQDYPKEKMEVLVIDGMSEDGTRDIIKKYIQKYPFIKLIDNKNKTTPFALNIGIKASEGDIIMMTGAHSYYEKEYVSKCVRYSREYDADNVGGVRVAIEKNEDIVTRAIVQAITSFFGAGDAYYIIGSKGPREVDTVFGGCYKREVFEKIGLFNERLTRTQDMEFNLRLKRAGGKIILVPDIKVYYYPRRTYLKGFFMSNFDNGLWVIYPLKFVKTPLRLRHYIPIIFTSSLLISGILGIFYSFFLYVFLCIFLSYILVALYFSIKILVKKKDIRFLFLMPLVFSIRHIGYGLGSLWGLLTIWKIKELKKNEQ